MITVSGSSQHEISATERVAKPSTPISAGTLTPLASSTEAATTTTTATAALTMLFAPIVRERSSRGLFVCRIA